MGDQSSVQLADPAEKLDYSIHPSIKNKPAWKPEYANHWESRRSSLDGLRDHISSGGAFIPAAMSSSHRTSAAFRHADLAVVDVDHGLTIAAFLSHPLAAEACWVYTTASHDPSEGKDRYRVIFWLDERIEDPEEYKQLVSYLIQLLGGDQSCKDPCRLFYGNSNADHPLWQPSRRLSPSLQAEARRAMASSYRHPREQQEVDAITMEQAIYVLEEVLEPTADGERDRFIKITAAASSAGEALFPAWSDWASRGHHGTGKNAKQTTEKFFRGFSGKSSVATLFFCANEEKPNWRDDLPEELRKGRPFATPSHNAVGFDHESFLGLDEPPDAFTMDRIYSNTASIFDATPPWSAPAKTLPSAHNEEPLSDEKTAPPRSTETTPSQSSRRFIDDDDSYDYDGDLTQEQLAAILAEQEALEAMDPYYDDPYHDHDSDQRDQQRQRRRKDRDGEFKLFYQLVSAKFPDLRLNLLTQKIEYTTPDGQTCVLEDPTMVYVYISMEQPRMLPKTAVADFVKIYAKQSSYHPVKDYLEACARTVEPCPFFDKLGTTILGLPEDDLRNPIMANGQRLGDIVLQRFMIAAVARIFDPGCQMQWMPILVGPQAIGKSRFFQMLTPPVPAGGSHHPWTVFNQFSLQYLSDHPHCLHCAWIVVMDESERHFKREDVEKLKNLVSIAVDRSARKYENELDFKRSFVLAGASNSDTFLKDPTGNRRFMPIYVEGKVPHPLNPDIRQVDFACLEAHRDALWSAAYHAYQAGIKEGKEPWHFESYELASVDDYMSGFYADSPFASKLAMATRHGLELKLRTPLGIHHERYYITLDEIFQYLDVPLDRYNSVSLAITDAIKRQGYSHARIKMAGKKLRVWFLPDDLQEPLPAVSGLSHFPQTW